ncbi:MAG TPA: glutamate--cysteine ligase [Geminicoccaceae bacterium]|nr:glutamate--cysteine ligase [Geminicoccaceae bacterium]
MSDKTARILRQLDRSLVGRGDQIETWFLERFAATPAPVYTSVDLRHSGLKLAPVDTNLFPAGLQNLNPSGRRRAAMAMRGYLASRHPGATRLLLVPEDHSRNVPYFDNLDALSGMLKEAGAEVRLGGLREDFREPVVLSPSSGRELVVEPLERRGDRLATADGFVPDVIVLNNDLSTGVPAPLQGLVQPVTPPPELGWYRRRKSAHFAAYDGVARPFAEELGLDPWLITTYWHRCGEINFRERVGLECVARGVDEVIAMTHAKYREHGVESEPYAFVKADGGTYGMGIMTVRSGEEVMTMNKRRRHSMQATKGGVPIAEVVIQEGVPTVDLIDGAPAEPVVYLIDGKPVGGFYRLHHARGEYDSLNAVGADFAEMCEEVEPSLEPGTDTGGAACNFRVFGTLARLAALAAAREVALQAEAAAA